MFLIVTQLIANHLEPIPSENCIVLKSWINLANHVNSSSQPPPPLRERRCGDRRRPSLPPTPRERGGSAAITGDSRSKCSSSRSKDSDSGESEDFRPRIRDGLGFLYSWRLHKFLTIMVQVLLAIMSVVGAMLHTVGIILSHFLPCSSVFQQLTVCLTKTPYQ